MKFIPLEESAVMTEFVNNVKQVLKDKRMTLVALFDKVDTNRDGY